MRAVAVQGGRDSSRSVGRRASSARTAARVIWGAAAAVAERAADCAARTAVAAAERAVAAAVSPTAAVRAALFSRSACRSLRFVAWAKPELRAITASEGIAASRFSSSVSSATCPERRAVRSRSCRSSSSIARSPQPLPLSRASCISVNALLPRSSSMSSSQLFSCSVLSCSVLWFILLVLLEKGMFLAVGALISTGAVRFNFILKLKTTAQSSPQSSPDSPLSIQFKNKIESICPPIS